MLNSEILIKFQQRLDKLSSSDFANLEWWMYIEAFNKGQIQWVRRQLQGINQTGAGAEGSTRRIDDLEFILPTMPVTMTDNGRYWSCSLPADYLQWNRVSAYAQDACKDCPPRQLIIFESTEVDLDINLNNSGKRPSYQWATTFATVSDKTVKIWTNDEFDIVNPTLTYYRVPVNIEITGIANPVTGIVSATDIQCEAPDNIIELMIDEGVSILSRDIQNYQLMQSTMQENERNT